MAVSRRDDSLAVAFSPRDGDEYNAALEGRFADSDSELHSELPFEELISDEAVLGAIYDMGFDAPSQIQCQAIPILAGPQPASLIAQAPSGSGKTVAFLTSILLRVDRRLAALQGIVLTHTLELTDQIFKVAMAMNAKLGLAIGWAANREYDVAGGAVPQILIGTPSGVLRNILKRHIATSAMQLVIVDEADKLLHRQGAFIEDMEMLLGSLGRRSAPPVLSPDITVGFFSASFSDAAVGCCWLLRPEARAWLRRGVPSVIEHFYTVVDDPPKAAPEIMRRYYCSHVDTGQAVVFFGRKDIVDDFAAAMNGMSYTCGATHGDIGIAERRRVMDDFADGKLKLLATTDLLARGLDIPQVFLVVQVRLTHDWVQDRSLGVGCGTGYQHRAGRAGRYGRNGVCLSIINRREMRLLRAIEADLGIVIRELRPDDDLPGEVEVN
jgi:ATP-dependent RNA helicase DDX19/DBP5